MAKRGRPSSKKAVEATVYGLDEIEKLFEQLGPRSRQVRKISRMLLASSLRPFVDGIRGKVAVDTGALRHSVIAGRIKKKKARGNFFEAYWAGYSRVRKFRGKVPYHNALYELGTTTRYTKGRGRRIRRRAHRGREKGAFLVEQNRFRVSESDLAARTDDELQKYLHRQAARLARLQRKTT